MRWLLDGIRAVFFDAVGTVLHPEPGAPAVYAEAARHFGLPAQPTEILSRFRAAFLREEDLDRAAGWVTSEGREVARWRAIVTEALPGSPPECFERLFGHFARPGAWRVPADAPPLFAALAARGWKLGLASNYDSRLETVLAGRPELAPLAGRVVVSSRVGVRKPGAGFFAAVAAAAGCPPGEIVYVGDDPDNDFHGAIAFGMRAVLLDPLGRHADLTPRVSSFEEFAKHLT